MKIKNQNIYGGQQLFADNINNFGNLNSAEKQLVNLIQDKDTLKSLEILKSKESTENEKKISGGILKKFLDSGAGEAGKIIIQELIKSGVDYIKYLT